MAITLDELLGRNRGDAADEYTSDRFPSYGEFSARRTGGSDVRYADGGEGYAYDFDRRPQSAPVRRKRREITKRRVPTERPGKRSTVR